MSRESLEMQIALYTKLIDEAIAEGDEESAEELLNAVNKCCDMIDAMQ